MPKKPSDMFKAEEVADQSRVDMFCNQIDEWLDDQDRGLTEYNPTIQLIEQDAIGSDLEEGIINTFDFPNELELDAICAQYRQSGWHNVQYRFTSDDKDRAVIHLEMPVMRGGPVQDPHQIARDSLKGKKKKKKKR